jgi:hypothetical protein
MEMQILWGWEVHWKALGLLSWPLVLLFPRPLSDMFPEHSEKMIFPGFVAEMAVLCMRALSFSADSQGL